jgi:hypothetical protein
MLRGGLTDAVFHPDIRCLSGPILDGQIRNPVELPGVVGDQRGIKRAGVCGNQQVQRPDGFY